MIDTMLGKYRILQRLGEGGMGTVYKARDELIDRIVAIKVLRPELTGNPQLLDRFRAEAVALARLNHPKIAILHGLEQNGSELYMVMEFLPGETVEKMIKNMGRIPWPRAVEIAAEVLSALDHAHDMGVVHRDIKPANVMVSAAGVKVMDFGIARITGRDRNTRVGHTVGTPVYMSPEQLRGEEVDGRADLYAVGGMLYEMVTGAVTFEAESDYDLMMKQLNDPPPVAGSVVADLPPTLDDIIQRALAKRREDRFVSSAAMQASLLATLASRGASSPASAVSSSDAMKATRVVGSSVAEGLSAAAASTASSSESGFQTRVANQTSHSVPLHRDWRAWVAAASVVVAIGIVVTRDGDKSDVSPVADTTAVVATDNRESQAVPRPVSSNTAHNEASSGSSVVAQPPVSVGGTSMAPPSVPTNVPVSAPANGGPTSSDSDNAAQREPVRTPTRARESTPPRRTSTSAENAARPSQTNSPPAKRDTATASESSSRATAPRVNTASRSDATDAANQFLSLLRARNADAFSAAVGGAGVNGSFMTAIKEGRVSAEAPSSVSLDGNNVSFSTTVTWRNPFGSNRRGNMRVSGSLVPSGGTWRLARARLLEVPDVK